MITEQIYSDSVRTAWKDRVDAVVTCNGSFDSDNLADILRADSTVVEKAAEAASIGGFSVRSFKRLLKVGRTIADLDSRKDMCQKDITEALSYRFRRIS